MAGVEHEQCGVGAALLLRRVTLDRPDMERHLTFVSEPRKLPVVLSPEEVGAAA